jgi:two-component system NtrC family sensor kinase
LVTLVLLLRHILLPMDNPVGHNTLEIIDSFALAMLKSANIDDLLWSIADSVGNILGYEDCVIYSCEESILVQIAAYGIKAEDRVVLNRMEIPLGEGMVGRVALTGIAEIVDDTENDPRYIFDQFSGLSELSVPVIYEGETIAVIDAEAPKKSAFNSSDLALITTIANIAAPRIASAKYLRALQKTQEDLEKSNATLQEKLEDLAKNQQLLIQSDKMASLGQLASGIAHEINNPLGFSLSNLETLKQYVSEVFTALDQAESVTSKRIEFLQEDMHLILEETIEGLSDAKDIVSDLRGFVRTSRSELVSVDLNSELRKTLSVYRNLFNNGCNLITDFGEISKVNGNPGQLNQVFANILINAVHACDGKGSVRVSTKMIDNWVAIEIEDDGCGVSEEDLPHLFTPFFTTKPVGQGTGLGLSICYRIIVDEHNGGLEVSSSQDLTRFTIKLVSE